MREELGPPGEAFLRDEWELVRPGESPRERKELEKRSRGSAEGQG